ncbi:hypothetical protein ACN26Y_15080 [Micromonospora sp. WMMD558]
MVETGHVRGKVVVEM